MLAGGFRVVTNIFRCSRGGAFRSSADDHAATNGREVLKLRDAYQNRINLVFTDMVMPERLSGLDLVERLRKMESGLKAIISSGYSTEIVQEGVLSSADEGFLPKPYEARELAENVWHCLHSQE